MEASLPQPIRRVRRDQHRKSPAGIGSDGEQVRLDGAVPEPLDDLGQERRGHGDGDAVAQCDACKDVKQTVLQRLQELVQLELCIGRGGAIFEKSSRGNVSLAVRQERRCFWGPREHVPG